ncbi:MAG: hypothetical protein ACJ77B_00045 [Chloroflexota bacterium]
MTTIRGFAATTAVVAIVVAACSASVASPPPTAAPSPSPIPAASTGPDDPVTTDPGSPNAGSGVAEPGPGQPTLVIPKPGQKNVHPVSIEQLEARVAGRHVVLNARWWSGVEPCSVLDSVAVKQDGKTITISVLEGNSGAEVACIDIAMLKATPIDLGDLDPGTYTIVAGDKSQAPPITVTVD